MPEGKSSQNSLWDKFVGGRNVSVAASCDTGFISAYCRSCSLGRDPGRDGANYYMDLINSRTARLAKEFAS